MRVTTERAQSALKAHHITGNLTNIVKDYAADLLEARDLIKEMREVMIEADRQANGYICPCENCTKLRSLIDKSRDYA